MLAVIEEIIEIFPWYRLGDAMKRWLPWLAAPLCLLAMVLSIFRPAREHWYGHGSAYLLRGPCGHSVGLTIWGPDPSCCVSSRRVLLWWNRIDASGGHSWGIEASALDTSPGI